MGVSRGSGGGPAPGGRHARPARQERSRRTLERLLDAAEARLEEKGLDGATVPAIAARSGLSVGVVYRRFCDKDALMRAVYERFFARSAASNREALDPRRWEGVATAQMVRTLVAGMVAGYRRHRGLLRALLLFAETHPDRRFSRRAEEFGRQGLRAIGRLLLTRRPDMAHPDPAGAVSFVLLVLGAALRVLLLSPEPRHAFLSGGRAARELAEICLRYLGIREEGRAGPA
jgi:AcrR family transcriptional regulator